DEARGEAGEGEGEDRTSYLPQPQGGKSPVGAGGKRRSSLSVLQLPGVETFMRFTPGQRARQMFMNSFGGANRPQTMTNEPGNSDTVNSTATIFTHLSTTPHPSTHTQQALFEQELSSRQRRRHSVASSHYEEDQPPEGRRDEGGVRVSGGF